MFILKIAIGAFWLYVGVLLIFREYLVWTYVENIEWFRKRFGNSTTKHWTRFCRDAGLVSLTTGCLLLLTLPFGLGILPILFFIPPLAFLR